MKTVFLLFFCLTATILSNENEIQPYPDNSLYPEQYQELGMPKPEVVWNGTAYKSAAKVIKKFYSVDKWSLPRKDSDYSGKLFERMINIENFEVIADKSESLQERLREHDEIINGINQFLNFYYEPNEQEQRFGAEFLAVLATSAKSTEYSINIIKEVQTMMSGRNRRNSDLDLMHDKLIAGVETSMEEYFNIISKNYQQYNQKDIEQFSEEITTWMYNMIHYLSQTQLKNIINQANSISEQHIYNDVQKNFKSILKALKKLEQQE